MVQAGTHADVITSGHVSLVVFSQRRAPTATEAQAERERERESWRRRQFVPVPGWLSPHHSDDDESIGPITYADREIHGLSEPVKQLSTPSQAQTPS